MKKFNSSYVYIFAVLFAAISHIDTSYKISDRVGLILGNIPYLIDHMEKKTSVFSIYKSELGNKSVLITGRCDNDRLYTDALASVSNVEKINDTDFLIKVIINTVDENPHLTTCNLKDIQYNAISKAEAIRISLENKKFRNKLKLESGERFSKELAKCREDIEKLTKANNFVKKLKSSAKSVVITGECVRKMKFQKDREGKVVEIAREVDLLEKRVKIIKSKRDESGQIYSLVGSTNMGFGKINDTAIIYCDAKKRDVLIEEK
jgi:hypothetical protein